MKFGIAAMPLWRFPELTSLFDLTKRAEELGFYSVQIGERILVPRSQAEVINPYFYNTIVVGSAIATLTQRIKIFYNVFVIPFHHPIRLAQELTSLDILSGGRVIVGAGVGWLQGEFEALGIPMRERGPRTDEGVKALKELWTARWPTFKGRYTSFEDIAFEPRPVQKPHPPIWIGGAVQRSLERAAELGDGWHPMRRGLEKLKAESDEVRRLLAQRNRTTKDFTFSYSVDYGSTAKAIRAYSKMAGSEDPIILSEAPDEAFSQLEALEQLGFSHLVIHFPGSKPEEIQTAMERFHRTIMQPLSKTSPPVKEERE